MWSPVLGISLLEWGSSGRPFKSGRPDHEEDGRWLGSYRPLLCLQAWSIQPGGVRNVLGKHQIANVLVLDEAGLAFSRS